MKKIVVLGFAGLLLAFGLFACTSASTSKEDIASQAIEINDKDIRSQILDNEAKAKQDWDGKTVKYIGFYHRVFNDEAEMYQEANNGLPHNSISVALSQDELASLEPGKTYTVIGTIKIESSTYSIDDAFLVSE